jgi:hypothetical protein
MQQHLRLKLCGSRDVMSNIMYSTDALTGKQPQSVQKQKNSGDRYGNGLLGHRWYFGHAAATVLFMKNAFVSTMTGFTAL